ncbi:MAG: hypothetical protein GY732_11955 [Gammaproteobacteria bacterium]|nr:hypothetical protein [Gammaproteobacteria bacterium]
MDSILPAMMFFGYATGVFSSFLHGNAKKLLVLIQLTLKVMITVKPARARPEFICPRCKSPMRIMGFLRSAWPPG